MIDMQIQDLIKIFNFLSEKTESVVEISMIEVVDGIRWRLKVIGKKVGSDLLNKLVEMIEGLGCRIVLVANRYELTIIFDDLTENYLYSNEENKIEVEA